MKTNVQGLGFRISASLRRKKELYISIEEAHKIKDDQLLILSTGAQGESNASLMKIITGEHRHITIKPGDTFVLSSSVIPGNERSVQSVKDRLRGRAPLYTIPRSWTSTRPATRERRTFDLSSSSSSQSFSCRSTVTISCALRMASPRAKRESRKRM